MTVIHIKILGLPHSCTVNGCFLWLYSLSQRNSVHTVGIFRIQMGQPSKSTKASLSTLAQQLIRVSLADNNQA